MPTLGANLCCKFSYPLQNRISSIFWSNKNGANACLNGRVYSSSVPVRYIPKKIRESQTYPSVGDPEQKEASEVLGSNVLELRVLRGENRSQRKFVSDDRSWSQIRTQNEMPSEVLGCNALELRVLRGENSCQRMFVSDDMSRRQNRNQNEMPSNDLMSDEPEHGLGNEFDHKVVDYDFEGEIGEDVEEDNFLKQKDHPQVSKTKHEAEKAAVKLLAARAFTAVELRKKLHVKKFPPDVIEGVINDFQGRGLINDCLYAETYSRSRWSCSTWGPRRIKQALLKKGVSVADTEKAVTLVFKEGESVENQGSTFGLSKLSMDRLFVQASRQWLRGQNVPRETQKSRLVRWLQYRGFSWDVISYTLKRLESQYPS